MTRLPRSDLKGSTIAEPFNRVVIGPSIDGPVRSTIADGIPADTGASGRLPERGHGPCPCSLLGPPPNLSSPRPLQWRPCRRLQGTGTRLPARRNRIAPPSTPMPKRFPAARASRRSREVYGARHDRSERAEAVPRRASRVEDWRASVRVRLLIRRFRSGPQSGSHGRVSSPRSSVGSGTGAPILGSGGCSIAFALGLSPAPMITFPTPASSNAACGFPALRFPIAFIPRFMWPIDWGALSAGDSGPGIVRTIQAAHIATAYSTSSSQIPDVRAGASDVAVSSSRPNP